MDRTTSSAPLPPQTTWWWDSGVSQYRVEYLAETETPEGGIPSGKLTWFEEIAPEDDERGNGFYTHSTQTLAEFFKQGPHNNPPVDIIESLLATFQAEKPSWFDSYRLLQAAQLGDVAAVETLLARGVPPDTALNGLTPFYGAVALRNPALADRLFVAGVDVNRHFPGSQETILMTLVGNDATWEPLAARIIAQGADLEAQDERGGTVLMNAVGAVNLWLVPLLLKTGANVDVVSQHGYTPLMNAIHSRDAPTDNLKHLLAAGAQVNTRDKEGWSALMRAIAVRHVEAVRLLLEAGADVQASTTPTQAGRSPQSVMQFALDYTTPEIIALIRPAGSFAPAGLGGATGESIS